MGLSSSKPYNSTGQALKRMNVSNDHLKKAAIIRQGYLKEEAVLISQKQELLKTAATAIRTCATDMAAALNSVKQKLEIDNSGPTPGSISAPDVKPVSPNDIDELIEQIRPYFSEESKSASSQVHDLSRDCLLYTSPSPRDRG